MIEFKNFNALVEKARGSINVDTVGEVLHTAENAIATSIAIEPFLNEWKYSHSIRSKEEGNAFLEVFTNNFKDKTQLTVKLCESFNYKIETYYILFSFEK